MNIADRIGAIVWGIGTLLAAVSLIQSVILRASISMFNAISSPRASERVREPSLQEAMAVMFITFFGNAAIALAVAYIAGEDIFDRSIQFWAQLMTLPFGLLGMSMLLSRWLPTTFTCAVLIAICHSFVSALFVAMIYLIFFAMRNLGLV